MFRHRSVYYRCMETEQFIDTFCRLQQKLHLVACRLLKDDMEAEDAVQDAFCNLWCARLPVSDTEARYRLFAVLKNVCLNKLRRRRPAADVEELEIPVETPDHYDALRVRDELLGYLTPLQRKVFTLSAYEEMEYEEIACALEMTVEAVRTQMCRARKILREQYKRLEL